MKKLMTIIGMAGIMLLIFGLMICLFIDLPKIWILIPIGMMASFLCYDSLKKEGEA